MMLTPTLQNNRCRIGWPMSRAGLALLIALPVALAASQAGAATLTVTIGPQYAGPTVQANPERAIDVAVDGKMVGTAAKDKPLVLDVPAGSHTVTRYQRTIWGPKYPMPFQVTVPEAGLHLQAVNYIGKADAGGVLGGLAGGALYGAVAGAASTLAPAGPGEHPHGEFLEPVTP